MNIRLVTFSLTSSGSDYRSEKYLGFGGNDVDLVDSPKRASVDAEWSSDEQKSGGQLLQEDDALSLVDSSQNDQNRAGSDGRTQFTAGRMEKGIHILAKLRLEMNLSNRFQH